VSRLGLFSGWRRCSLFVTQFPNDLAVVYETIIDDDRSKNAFGLLMSLNMLIETEHGFDYTAADCMGWMTDAGFSKTRAEHLIGPDSMVIGVK
jgi:hypothetical protein